MKANIGGGRGWKHEGWTNLDVSTGFALTPDCVFPFADDSLELAYSSHCLEHLDDATVDRVLSETWRCLKRGHPFVIKIPDFEQVLERWRAGDEAYFDHWGMQDVTRTWASKGVPVNIDSKAAMIFCGWWNDAYGDEFGNRNPQAAGAYHGPALVPNHDYACFKNYESPHLAAIRLAISAEGYPHKKAVHFNHRNAWSRAEMWELLTKRRFLPSTFGVHDASEIPGYWHQNAISAYFHAGKA